MAWGIGKGPVGIAGEVDSELDKSRSLDGEENLVSQVPAVKHTKKRRKCLFCISRFISHRLVIVKARMVLLLVICVVIMLTAVFTWRVSLRATNKSFEAVSAQLREDVTNTAVVALMDTLSDAGNAFKSLYVMLDGLVGSYTRETLSGPVLAGLWGTFSTYTDATCIYVVSKEGLMSGYRRDGPEVPLLGSDMAVAFPSPANDPLSFLQGYVPDPVTGAPLLNGPTLKMCYLGSCPEPLNMSLYVPPSVPPLQSPAWLAGQGLARGALRWSTAIDSVLQPILFVAGALQDPDGHIHAVLSLQSTSTKLMAFVRSTSLVQHYNGRIFVTVGRKLNILTASHGDLYTPSLVPGGRPSFVSAVQSSDEIIQSAARYLNETYGEQLFTDPRQMFTSLTRGTRHYVHVVPIQHDGLQLLVVLAVPQKEFRGEMDDSRRHALLMTLTIVVSMFLAGNVAMCLSTLMISRTLTTQERSLGEAAAANEALTKQLEELTFSADSAAWPNVDMGTPLEKLLTIIKSLRPGHVMTSRQLKQMHELVTVDDLHKPQFLARFQSSNRRSQDSPELPGAQVDSETGSWIEIFATGRRGTRDHQRNNNSQQPRRQSQNSLDICMPGLNLTDQRGGGVGAPLASLYESSDGEGRSPYDGVSYVKLDGGGELFVGAQRPHASPPVGARQHASLAPRVFPPPQKPGLVKLVRLLSQHAGHADDEAFETLRTMVSLALPGDLTLLNGGSGVQPDKLAVSACWGALPISSALHPTAPSPGMLPRLVSPCVSGEGRASGEAQRGGNVEPAVVVATSRRQVTLLSTLGTWEFDTLALAQASPHQVLQLVGFTLFVKGGLVSEFHINERKLANFLEQIACGMQPHPYHNAAHISDVSASLFHLLSHSGVSNHVRRIDRLAAICAALVHDYKHPGVNNDFLNRTKEELAIIYNDQSPLENYHLAEAFHLLYSNEHCNFLEVLCESDYNEVRRVIIDLVLASDLKRHFGILDQFKARACQGTPWDAKKETDRLLLLQMALKVADLGHSAKPLAIHKEWSRRVTEEFYKQGDAEREADLDVSPFMDRFNNNVPRSQLGFFQFLALPLFEAWVKAFPQALHLMANVSNNIAHWKQELHAMDL